LNIENYNKTFPKWPPLVKTDRWVYGVWVIGNDYRNKSRYYGTYPPTYLKRVRALFPDSEKVLHLFSGDVEKGYFPSETTLDINQELKPDIVANSSNIPFKENSFDLILVDPPYSKEDAEKYGYPMPNRKKALHECYRVLKPNGFVVWLDVVLPMYRKIEFNLVGTIGLIRSTNHRTRTVLIWQKNDALSVNPKEKMK
jgi:SAM-dependent methyltransferase